MIKISFFQGVLETRFGSLESQTIIIGSLKSEKIGSLQIHIGYLTFSLKKLLKYQTTVADGVSCEFDFCGKVSNRCSKISGTLVTCLRWLTHTGKVLFC